MTSEIPDLFSKSRTGIYIPTQTVHDSGAVENDKWREREAKKEAEDIKRFGKIKTLEDLKADHGFTEFKTKYLSKEALNNRDIVLYLAESFSFQLFEYLDPRFKDDEEVMTVLSYNYEAWHMVYQNLSPRLLRCKRMVLKPLCYDTRKEIVDYIPKAWWDQESFVIRALEKSRYVIRFASKRVQNSLKSKAKYKKYFED